jgi:hypothetical protein
MRSFLFVSMALALVACGDDGGSPGVDAPPMVDAGPDAPGPLMGLGQRCIPSMGGADCPDPLGCLGNPASTMPDGMCTAVCAMNTMFMTDAQGAPGNPTPDPTAQNATCASMYTGGIGTAGCNSPFGLTPAHNPLMASTNYTVSWACGIQCGAGNTCPTGYTCTSGLCR